MPTNKAKVLVVEEDQNLREEIDKQILRPLGYQVVSTGNATDAISRAIKEPPDLIIANIDLSDLSGKDMLVALSSQGIKAPVILLAEEGLEKEAIRAFRLGAVDYLGLPIKEAEIVSAVERTVTQNQTTGSVAAPPQQTIEKISYLEDRIKDLTKVIRVAKTLTSSKDPQQIFKNAVESSLHFSEADRGWMMLREYHTPKYILRFYQNLPDSMTDVVGKPWDDGITSLVIEAQETLHMKEIKSEVKEISKLGSTALAVPISDRGEILGSIILIRIVSRPFQKSTQKIIETIAEFTSIALRNCGFLEITKPEP